MLPLFMQLFFVSFGCEKSYYIIYISSQYYSYNFSYFLTDVFVTMFSGFCFARWQHLDRWTFYLGKINKQ